MKKIVLVLALTFSAGLMAQTAALLTDKPVTVLHEKDKKKKKSKKGKSCEANGEKKSCCAHGKTEEKK